MIESKANPYTAKWLINNINNKAMVGEWDLERKVFVSNVGGFNTAEYPIGRMEIMEAKKCRFPNLYMPNLKSDDIIKVIALIQVNDYNSEDCITIKDLLDFINAENEDCIIAGTTEGELRRSGTFCKIIGMHDASPGSNHDCDNIEARKVYGENIFRLWS